MTRAPAALVALLLTALLLTPACSSGSPATEHLTVLVDPEVGDPLEDLEAAFEDANPTVTLEVELVPTEEIGDRLRAGELADIVIARRTTVDQLRAEEIAQGDALVFATNVFQITVPEGNPANVTGLADFTSALPTRTGIPAEDSSGGTTARQLLARANIEAAPDVDDLPWRDLVAALSDRTLDAALLWRTQAARSSTPLSSVAIPLEYEQRKDFAIASIENAPKVERVVRWLATDPISQELLQDAGLRDAAGPNS